MQAGDLVLVVADLGRVGQHSLLVGVDLGGVQVDLLLQFIYFAPVVVALLPGPECVDFLLVARDLLLVDVDLGHLH